MFVSSTVHELADERAAARRTIERLRLTPVLFEAGARPRPPRDLYHAYLQQSDVFVGIYGRRSGWPAPGGAASQLEDEYQASANLPRLLYVKAVEGEREPSPAMRVPRSTTRLSLSSCPAHARSHHRLDGHRDVYCSKFRSGCRRRHELDGTP